MSDSLRTTTPSNEEVVADLIEGTIGLISETVDTATSVTQDQVMDSDPTIIQTSRNTESGADTDATTTEETQDGNATGANANTVGANVSQPAQPSTSSSSEPISLTEIGIPVSSPAVRRSPEVRNFTRRPDIRRERVNSRSLTRPRTWVSDHAVDMRVCLTCQEARTDSMVECKWCDREYHTKCLPYTQEELDRIETFYCEICEEAEHIIVWKGVRATGQKLEDKRKNYFEFPRY